MLATGVVIFLLAALGLGLLISTVSKTQQQAMIAAFFLIMPTIMLSGFGTPISSMPAFFQKISYLNSLHHVLIVLRGVYLKGVGFDVLWPEMAIMALSALILLTLSVLRFPARYSAGTPGSKRADTAGARVILAKISAI